MLKNPYNVLKELSKGQFDRSKALFEFGHGQSDSFITWIIGFGVAAISLLVANLEALHRNVHHLFDMPFIRQGEIKLQELHRANIAAQFSLPYHVLGFSGFIGEEFLQFLDFFKFRLKIFVDTARSLVPILRWNGDAGSDQVWRKTGLIC